MRSCKTAQFKWNQPFLSFTLILILDNKNESKIYTTTEMCTQSTYKHTNTNAMHIHIELFNVKPFNYTWYSCLEFRQRYRQWSRDDDDGGDSVLLLFDIYSNEWMMISFHLSSIWNVCLVFFFFFFSFSFFRFFKPNAQLFIIYNVIKREEKKLLWNRSIHFFHSFGVES